MYKVGIAQGVLADNTRNNWAGDAPRPIAWMSWYPTDHTATGETLNVPTTSTEVLFAMRGGIIDASLNTTRANWPVVLLSHGTGGSASGMDWLGSRLAATGYIAIAISHHGNTAVEPYVPEGFLCWWERATDLSITLDRLSETTRFSGHMDFNQIFAAGFSLGAYTVLALAGAITKQSLFDEWLQQQPRTGPNGPKEFPDLSERIPWLTQNSAEFNESNARHDKNYRDHRIKAIAALAPPPPIRAFTSKSLTAIDLPVHIIVGQADTEAPHDTCAVWLDQHLADSSLTLLGNDVGHYVFLNESTELGRQVESDICCDPASVDRSVIHHQTAQAIATFFSSPQNDG